MRVGLHLADQPIGILGALVHMNHPAQNIARPLGQLGLMNRTAVLMNPDMAQLMREDAIEQLGGQPRDRKDGNVLANDPPPAAMDVMPRKPVQTGMRALTGLLQEAMETHPIHEFERNVVHIHLNTPLPEQGDHALPAGQGFPGSANRFPMTGSALGPSIPQPDGPASETRCAEMATSGTSRELLEVSAMITMAIRIHEVPPHETLAANRACLGMASREALRVMDRTRWTLDVAPLHGSTTVHTHEAIRMKDGARNTQDRPEKGLATAGASHQEADTTRTARASTSTAAPRGSEATPTAARA